MLPILIIIIAIFSGCSKTGAHQGRAPVAPAYEDASAGESDPSAKSTPEKQPGENFEKKQDVPKDKLLFVMGGFGSCRNGPAGLTPLQSTLHQKLQDVISDLGTKAPVWVVSCFGMVAPTETLYISSKSAIIKKASSEAFVDQVLEDKSYDVMAVGHSYGGWLAMLNATGGNIDHLITVDPISPLGCSAANYLTGFERILSSPGASVVGCDRAPQEFDLATIDARTESWKHFYQTAMPWLHSSPLARSPAGTLVPFPPADLLAHKNISLHDMVWEKVIQWMVDGSAESE